MKLIQHSTVPVSYETEDGAYVLRPSLLGSWQVLDRRTGTRSFFNTYQDAYQHLEDVTGNRVSLHHWIIKVASEYGDVEIKNGIVHVTCLNGDVWTFTEPKIEKIAEKLTYTRI